MSNIKYTKELLQDVVGRSTCMAQVIRSLGLRQAGGNYYHLKNKIKKFGIDFSHFNNKPSLQFKRKKLSASEILVELDYNANRPKSSMLSRAMKEIGVPYECCKCHLGSIWCGDVITLHVDHINGNWNDCRPHNVRFICPNCHSQTETFGSKNKFNKLRSSGVCGNRERHTLRV